MENSSASAPSSRLSTKVRSAFDSARNTVAVYWVSLLSMSVGFGSRRPEQSVSRSLMERCTAVVHYIRSFSTDDASGAFLWLIVHMEDTLDRFLPPVNESGEASRNGEELSSVDRACRFSSTVCALLACIKLPSPCLALQSIENSWGSVSGCYENPRSPALGGCFGEQSYSRRYQICPASCTIYDGKCQPLLLCA